MISGLVRAILARLSALETAQARLVYGTATGANQVRIDNDEPTSAGFVYEAIETVFSGQRVAVLDAGGDRLIIGPVGGRMILPGQTSVTTNASGLATINFAPNFAAEPVVVATLKINSPTRRVVVYSASTSSFTVLITNNDAPEANAGRTVNWIAIGVPA